MYTIQTGKKIVKFCDSSSDEEDSKKRNKRKSKEEKKSKKTSARCGPILYASGPIPMRFPPGATPIYASPPQPRPIFAAHIQVAQPMVPCPMIAVTHTQLYPPPAMPSFGLPSTTYVLQAVNQAPATVPVAVAASAVPAAGVYSAGAYPAMQSPYMIPIYSG